MEWMDPLTANLLDLLFELREHPIPLTIGGGFGLYLKRMRLDQTREGRSSRNCRCRGPPTTLIFFFAPTCSAISKA